MNFSRITQRLCFSVGLLIVATAFHGATAQQIQVLSTRADSVSGGDAVIQVRVPSGVSVLDVAVLRNGVDVSNAFVATDLTTCRDS
jgi:hypothetical protein